MLVDSGHRRRQRGIRSLLRSGLVSFLLAGSTLLSPACGPETSGGASPSGEGAAEAASPQRILTLAPNVAEIAFALGLGRRVVGVGDFVRWPPAAAAKPRLGGLIDPNLERMVRLRPDLAVLLPSEDDVARSLRRLGVEVLTVPIENLAELEAGVTAIGRRCDAEPEARRLNRELAARLAPRDVAGGLRVLVTIDRPPGAPAQVLAAGPGTFLDELLDRLGAVNAVADAGLRYPQIGLETVVARDPQVILELGVEELSAAEEERLRRDWLAAPGLSAPARGTVFFVRGAWTSIPGPRLPQLYEAMAAAFSEARARLEEVR